MIKQCIICGKDIPEHRLKQGKKTCCRNCQLKTVESRQKLSNSLKKTWSNEEKRQLQSKKLKQAYENPELRQKLSKLVKNSMTEEVKTKMSESTKKAYESPELRQKTSEATKRMWQNPEIRQKMSDSIRKALSNPEIRQKISDSIRRALLNPEIKQKRTELLKKVHLERYDEIQQKIYNTKKANCSFNISKSELYAKELLEQAFNKVYYQYKCDRYPFNCDFYIEDLDLFIECHFNWTHGGAPYDKNEQWCIEQLSKWQEKAKTSKFYQNAIYQWTDLDVRKAQIAKEHNLNWVVFYSLDELKRQYNNE